MAGTTCETYRVQGARLERMYAEKGSRSVRGLYWQARGRQACSEGVGARKPEADLQEFGTKHFWVSPDDTCRGLSHNLSLVVDDVLYFPMDPHAFDPKQSYAR